MTRKVRGSVLYDGCFAHVFSRSIEKRFIFKREKDFEYFKALLLEAKKRFEFRVFHYCLLQTHFHLAVGLGSLESFSLGMKWVKWQYTTKYNQARKRRGTVWQSRFNSLVIEDEDYLRACGHYIEMNPVEAGISLRAVDWKYSSARYYEMGQEDPLVDGYEWGGALPQIEGDPRKLFEKGEGIGSALYRLKAREETLSPVTVS